GKPSRPTSASSFSSSRRVRTSPSVPGVAWRGVRLTELLKCMLPRPPLPPRATSRRWPCSVMSPITSSVSTLWTTVPTGTVMTLSSPALPYIWLPMPFSPRWALNRVWWRKSTRVLRFSSASSQTSPPLPPSPPFGPPSGMNFSRRNATQPLPPLPAVTVISASSTSFMWVIVQCPVKRVGSWKRQVPLPPLLVIPASAGMTAKAKTKNPAEAGFFAMRRCRLTGGDDVDRAALLRTLGGELHLAVDQREQGVVATQADAGARVELGATLADDDVAGLDGLAAVDLHAQVLRVGVAAVARGTYAL